MLLRVTYASIFSRKLGGAIENEFKIKQAVLSHTHKTHVTRTDTVLT